jgi:hypothetical protein
MAREKKEDRNETWKVQQGVVTEPGTGKKCESE